MHARDHRFIARQVCAEHSSLAAHRSGRSAGTFYGRTKGFQRDASQAQSDYFRTYLWHGARYSGHSFVGLENVALWHERDISHSSAERVVLPDSSIALDYMLHKATLIAGLVVHPERMLENLQLTRGLVFSGQLLLALTQKGVSRETAYEWVQRNAMKVWDQNENFQELLQQDPDIKLHLSPQRLKERLATTLIYEMSTRSFPGYSTRVSEARISEEKRFPLSFDIFHLLFQFAVPLAVPRCILAVFLKETGNGLNDK